MLKLYIESKGLSLYQCSKLSGVPYATLNELCNHKSSIEKCNVGTIYKICKALDISVDEFLDNCFEPRIDFENFKSNICQKVKNREEQFILDTIKNKTILKYWEKEWFPEALYTLAMLDYLCRKNEVPICNTYEVLRHKKLSNTIYPQSVIALSMTSGKQAFIDAKNNAIPEFLRHNIVEGEVESVA